MEPEVHIRVRVILDVLGPYKLKSLDSLVNSIDLESRDKVEIINSIISETSERYHKQFIESLKKDSLVNSLLEDKSEIESLLIRYKKILRNASESSDSELIHDLFRKFCSSFPKI